MITKNNFRKLLESLEFAEANNIFSKKINGELLQADFDHEKLVYPEGITIEGDFTLNFSDNENFVVFECVHRLLSLGYKPIHLILEPKWKLGHGASGGRADIVIKNNDKKVFAIIECKTAGKEFDDAWSAGLQYPSQLFSYAQQEGSTELICLYTSNLVNEVVDYSYYAIPLVDNQNLLQTISSEDVATYAKANRFDELFTVWKNTYHQEAFTKGFLESDIQPFEFGKKNYSINDLKEISHADIQKKYHQFATILRKYNVSGRENAFDKLVNLFLCKVVDEKENSANLKFYWRGMAYDTDFDLQDRLQQLYQQGMKQFLGEEVTYINQEKIDEAFRFLQNDPDATKETINNYFKQLKFFTNNDFAFIDVHNEKLFYQNAEILLRIVEMLQDIHLKNDSEEHSNQFLGDMFEGFLDAGVKQSEGQFFTPMPIVKFIMNSLPLEQLIAESEQPPKAIDYACGAGHFLTELAMQLKPLVDKYKKSEIKDYYSRITGIEKEYRLSKVAKVSVFMYGQDDINIIYADALARNPDIEEGTYQILVANPPYSVRGFLETLTIPDKKNFELYGSIDSKSIVTNNAIETFFIERAKQLLAPQGIAAIILPSSVLSNDAKQYQKTREILLKYFHIIAIAELGSGTFGKTGTNTVTLFLKRRPTNPSEAVHYRNRMESWIVSAELNSKNKKNKLYDDLHLLQAYCTHVGFGYEDYKALWTDEAPNEAMDKSDMWQEYEKAFCARTDIKSYQKKPAFKKLTELQQKEQLAEMLFAHVKEIEKEKLYYFLLAYSNAAPVLLIKSPSDNKAMKKFLGYEWSSAKGNEGIKYMNAPQVVASDDEIADEPVLAAAQLHSIQTPLYNPVQKEDKTKLNYYIQQNFLGNKFILPDALQEFAHQSLLIGMLDFSRKDFNKAFSFDLKKSLEIVSKWEIKKLDDLNTFLQRGKNTTYGNSDIQVIKSGQARGGKSFDFSNPVFASETFISDERNLKQGDVLINSTGVGTAGRVTLYNLEGKFVADNHITILRVNHRILAEYVLYYFEDFIGFKNLEALAKGISGQIELSLSEIQNIKIPIPPISLQQDIINECQKIDDKITDSQKQIIRAKQEIEEKIEGTFKRDYNTFSLAQIVTTNPSKSEIKALDDNMPVSFVEMASVSNEGFIERKEDRTLQSVRKGSYTYFAEGDVIVAKITPCMENGKSALAKNLTNGIGLGSSEFHVFRSSEKILPQYLFYHLNREKVRKEAESKMTGASGHRRVPISFYEALKIPVPVTIAEQQKIVDEIEILEAQIATAQNTINNAPAQKQAILKKYLE